MSKRLVGQFIDEVQQNCPTLSQSDLERTVTIFTNMEAARSGHELLEKLASCSPNDLDTWNRLMEELRQGEDYALELQKAQLVTTNTEIVVFVLGAQVLAEANAERIVGTSIRVTPVTYDIILKRAHARTFNLQRKLQATKPHFILDKDVEDIVAMPLFDITGAQSDRGRYRDEHDPLPGQNGQQVVMPARRTTKHENQGPA